MCIKYVNVCHKFSPHSTLMYIYCKHFSFATKNKIQDSFIINFIFISQVNEYVFVFNIIKTFINLLKLFLDKAYYQR